MCLMRTDPGTLLMMGCNSMLYGELPDGYLVTEVPCMLTFPLTRAGVDLT